MIGLEIYTKEFEQEYLNVVKKNVSIDLQSKILNSCMRYLPFNFFVNNYNKFDQLILAQFSKLNEAYLYINNNSIVNMKNQCFKYNSNTCNSLYKTYIKKYSNITQSVNNGKKLNVRIVENLNLLVCPYCNREYVNSRDKKCSGAQLDHFYNKNMYPIFALSLYNLVPVCSNCNRIKSNSNKMFASPFDTNINWENEVKFEFKTKGTSIDKILISSENEKISNNIEQMKIQESYQIHLSDLNKLQEKIEAYSDTQIQELKKSLATKNISEDYIKEIIFGSKIDYKSIKNKSLGRMLRDFYRMYKIYE